MNLKIKEICKSKGISITELAQSINIKQESLSRTINGNPTVSTLGKIANALEVSITNLFEPNNSDLTALIDYKGKLYRFDNIDELERFISSINAEKE